MTREELYRQARKRVKKKRSFRGHFTTFAVMSVFLFVLNMVTSPEYLWFLWAVGGWAISIIFHYFDAYGYPGQRDETEEIEREMVRLEDRELTARRLQSESRLDDDILDLDEPTRARERRIELDDRDFV